MIICLLLATLLPDAGMAQPPPCPHALSFRNDAGTSVDLQVGSLTRRVLAANVTARVCITADEAAWDVAAPAGWRYGGVADLRDLAQRMIVIVAPGGSVEVINRTGDVQLIELDDASYGSVEPDETRLIGPLTVGSHRLLARGKHGREWRPLLVQATPGATLRVLLTVMPTSAAVINYAKEAAMVRIDGTPWGLLAAGTATQVLGLVPGRHQAQLVGATSGEVRMLVVTAAAASQPPGQSAEIAVHVENLTGEPLHLPAGLRDFGHVLAIGASADWRLPRRTFGVTLKGEASELDYHFDFSAKDDPAERQWRIERPTATLRVENGAGEPVTVALGTVATGTTADAKGADGPFSLQSAEFREVVVLAGRLAVAAVTGQTSRRIAVGLFLKPGSASTWIVRAALTAVTIRNEDMESVAVRINGETRGDIAPGHELRFELPPGRHVFGLLGRRTGAVNEGVVLLRDGDVRTSTFTPPGAAVRVGNPSAAPLLVLVRGVQAAQVPEKTRVAVPVTPGRLLVEVRDPATGRTEVWSGLLVPTQQLDVEPPEALDTTIEATFQGNARRVRVWLDDAEPTELLSGEPWRLSGVRPGDHVLHVELDGRELRRRLHVDGHRAVNRFVLRQEKLLDAEPLAD